MTHQTHVSEDEIPCDFSSIMDARFYVVPDFTGEEPLKGIGIPDDTYEPPKTFLEQYLDDNPDVTFTRESVADGMVRAMSAAMGPELAKAAVEELRERWAHVGTTTMPEETTTLEDPVGDLIRHFAIFYEHVYLLEGYPKDVQPQLKELKLLGERIHKCLILNGELNTVNVCRCEEAHMNVTLDGDFIQVARGKAILRQRV